MMKRFTSVNRSSINRTCLNTKAKSMRGLLTTSPNSTQVAYASFQSQISQLTDLSNMKKNSNYDKKNMKQESFVLTKLIKSGIFFEKAMGIKPNTVDEVLQLIQIENDHDIFTSLSSHPQHIDQTVISSLIPFTMNKYSFYTSLIASASSEINCTILQYLFTYLNTFTKNMHTIINSSSSTTLVAACQINLQMIFSLINMLLHNNNLFSVLNYETRNGICPIADLQNNIKKLEKSIKKMDNSEQKQTLLQYIDTISMLGNDISIDINENSSIKHLQEELTNNPENAIEIETQITNVKNNMVLYEFQGRFSMLILRGFMDITDYISKTDNEIMILDEHLFPLLSAIYATAIPLTEKTHFNVKAVQRLLQTDSTLRTSLLHHSGIFPGNVGNLKDSRIPLPGLGVATRFTNDYNNMRSSLVDVDNSDEIIEFAEKTRKDQGILDNLVKSIKTNMDSDPKINTNTNTSLNTLLSQNSLTTSIDPIFMTNKHSYLTLQRQPDWLPVEIWDAWLLGELLGSVSGKMMQLMNICHKNFVSMVENKYQKIPKLDINDETSEQQAKFNEMMRKSALEVSESNTLEVYSNSLTTYMQFNTIAAPFSNTVYLHDHNLSIKGEERKKIHGQDIVKIGQEKMVREYMEKENIVDMKSASQKTTDTEETADEIKNENEDNSEEQMSVEKSSKNLEYLGGHGIASTFLDIIDEQWKSTALSVVNRDIHIRNILSRNNSYHHIPKSKVLIGHVTLTPSYFDSKLDFMKFTSSKYKGKKNEVQAIAEGDLLIDARYAKIYKGMVHMRTPIPLEYDETSAKAASQIYKQDMMSDFVIATQHHSIVLDRVHKLFGMNSSNMVEEYTVPDKDCIKTSLKPHNLNLLLKTLSSQRNTIDNTHALRMMLAEDKRLTLNKIWKLNNVACPHLVEPHFPLIHTKHKKGSKEALKLEKMSLEVIEDIFPEFREDYVKTDEQGNLLFKLDNSESIKLNNLLKSISENNVAEKEDETNEDGDIVEAETFTWIPLSLVVYDEDISESVLTRFKKLTAIPLPLNPEGDSEQPSEIHLKFEMSNLSKCIFGDRSLHSSLWRHLNFTKLNKNPEKSEATLESDVETVDVSETESLSDSTDIDNDISTVILDKNSSDKTKTSKEVEMQLAAEADECDKQMKQSTLLSFLQKTLKTVNYIPTSAFHSVTLSPSDLSAGTTVQHYLHVGAETNTTDSQTQLQSNSIRNALKLMGPTYEIMFKQVESLSKKIHDNDQNLRALAGSSNTYQIEQTINTQIDYIHLIINKIMIITNLINDEHNKDISHLINIIFDSATNIHHILFNLLGRTDLTVTEESIINPQPKRTSQPPFPLTTEQKQNIDLLFSFTSGLCLQVASNVNNRAMHLLETLSESEKLLNNVVLSKIGEIKPSLGAGSAPVKFDFTTLRNASVNFHDKYSHFSLLHDTIKFINDEIEELLTASRHLKLTGFRIGLQMPLYPNSDVYDLLNILEHCPSGMIALSPSHRNHNINPNNLQSYSCHLKAAELYEKSDFVMIIDPHNIAASMYTSIYNSSLLYIQQTKIGYSSLTLNKNKAIAKTLHSLRESTVVMLTALKLQQKLPPTPITAYPSLYHQEASKIKNIQTTLYLIQSIQHSLATENSMYNMMNEWVMMVIDGNPKKDDFKGANIDPFASMTVDEQFKKLNEYYYNLIGYNMALLSHDLNIIDRFENSLSVFYQAKVNKLTTREKVYVKLVDVVHIYTHIHWNSVQTHWLSMMVYQNTHHYVQTETKRIGISPKTFFPHFNELEKFKSCVPPYLSPTHSLAMIEFGLAGLDISSLFEQNIPSFIKSLITIADSQTNEDKIIKFLSARSGFESKKSDEEIDLEKRKKKGTINGLQYDDAPIFVGLNTNFNPNKIATTDEDLPSLKILHQSLSSMTVPEIYHWCETIINSFISTTILKNYQTSLDILYTPTNDSDTFIPPSLTDLTSLPKTPSLITPLSLLASIKLKQNKYEEAEALFRACLWHYFCMPTAPDNYKRINRRDWSPELRMEEALDKSFEKLSLRPIGSKSTDNTNIDIKNFQVIVFQYVSMLQELGRFDEAAVISSYIFKPNEVNWGEKMQQQNIDSRVNFNFETRK